VVVEVVLDVLRYLEVADQEEEVEHLLQQLEQEIVHQQVHHKVIQVDWVLVVHKIQQVEEEEVLVQLQQILPIKILLLQEEQDRQIVLQVQQ
jgi:hypothetical protein